MKRPGPTVMVADRNANIREWLRREFDRQGLAVQMAGSGVEVLAGLAAGAPVDVLVLDVEIESPDGERLSEVLARRYPNLPVVLHVFPGVDPGKGGVARVEKGRDFKQLEAVVRQVLEERVREDDHRPDGVEENADSASRDGENKRQGIRADGLSKRRKW